MGDLLRLTQVAKRFSGLEVLKDISFEVAEGEVLGLIGPNGAGKTTLFNIISGILKPNSGRVVFASKDITGLPTHRVSRLGIARTFQIPQPFAEMTVLENVRATLLFSNPRPEGKLPRDAKEICEMVGLGGRLEQPAGSLSAPEKKRLEVARALASSPRLLLLDEFAAGLTLSESSWASEMIKSLSKDYGVTIVWTEHVMKILMRSVERVLVLQSGEVIASGTPAEVVKNELVLKAYFGGKPA
ncbi:MAG: ABC transporter ATP-binding protein [Thaumarchaeota archaeon]|nr:ABC transporter ATP-binding protein [Nitrososphaerota archaeon]